MGKYFYQLDLLVGTPAQKINLLFDTGSAPLALPGINSTACLANKCYYDNSQFDVSKSSSWRYAGEGEDDWGGKGIIGNETISYAGQTLHNYITWVSKDHTLDNYGTWGQHSYGDPRRSFVAGLAAKGTIPRALFSLNSEGPIESRRYETHFDPVTNNVYYGGFDAAKYEGPLTTLDVIPDDPYAINITTFSVGGESLKLKKNMLLVFDTGGLSIGLTNATIALVSRKNGGSWTSKGYTVACDSHPELTYEFGATKIPVDLTSYVHKEDDGKCRLSYITVLPDNSNEELLAGPPFISRALIIFDFARGQITVGKAKYTSESNVVEITGDIPGAVHI